jgi:hypothetical protein
MTPLLPLLQLAGVSESLLPRYAVAWLLVHRVTQTRWDGDALLVRLALDGTLQVALQCNLWTLQWPEVRSGDSIFTAWAL